MIVYVTNTILALGCLLILGSIRLRSNNLTLFTVALTIVTIHFAHLLHYEEINKSGDHILLINAAFTFLYIPLLYVASQKLLEKLSRKSRIVLMSIGIGLFIWLYIKVTFDPSMSLYAYGNLLWTISNAIFFCCWINLAINSIKAVRSGNQRFLASVHILAFLNLAPFMATAIAAFVPQDNFVVAYNPLLSLPQMVQLLQLTAWFVLLFNLFRLKAELDASAFQTPSGTTNNKRLSWGK